IAALRPGGPWRGIRGLGRTGRASLVRPRQGPGSDRRIRTIASRSPPLRPFPDAAYTPSVTEAPRTTFTVAWQHDGAQQLEVVIDADQPRHGPMEKRVRSIADVA